jgi:exopolyphosphatase/pppGpp-phosphohydrolase
MAYEKPIQERIQRLRENLDETKKLKEVKRKHTESVLNRIKRLREAFHYRRGRE